MRKLQNTKAVISSDLKSSNLELLELQQSHFCRYDLDHSGTMNSSEELSQLTMSLVFKLQLMIPAQVHQLMFLVPICVRKLTPMCV